jgi:hypothetical protein
LSPRDEVVEVVVSAVVMALRGAAGGVDVEVDAKHASKRTERI